MTSPTLEEESVRATYQNREGERWELRGLRGHPILTGMLFATRADGVPVCVERSKITLNPQQGTSHAI